MTCVPPSSGTLIEAGKSAPTGTVVANAVPENGKESAPASSANFRFDFIVNPSVTNHRSHQQHRPQKVPWSIRRRMSFFGQPMVMAQKSGRCDLRVNDGAVSPPRWNRIQRRGFWVKVRQEPSSVRQEPSNVS